MKTRKELLEELLQLPHPGQIERIAGALAEYGWDSEEKLVTLTEDAVIAILRRYLSGELTRKMVEDWAWQVEGRDDIAVGVDENNNQLLFFSIPRLAFPGTEGELTPDNAKELIAKLEESKIHLLRPL